MLQNSNPYSFRVWKSFIHSNREILTKHIYFYLLLICSFLPGLVLIFIPNCYKITHIYENCFTTDKYWFWENLSIPIYLQFKQNFVFFDLIFSRFVGFLLNNFEIGFRLLIRFYLIFIQVFVRNLHQLFF